MYISDFNYHKPSSIKEACKILSESKDGAPLAGGTDLLVEMKQGLRQHLDIVSLTGINELRLLNEDENNLFIGSGLTHNEVAVSPVIRESFPAIAEAALSIGSDQVRNAGTIGGNICTGASCCDMAPILMAYNADVEIADQNDTRKISLDDFFVFHKETRIQKGEIMTRIIVPRIKNQTGACFVKFGLREAASISVASVAVFLETENNICKDARFVIGAVAPVPKVSRGSSEIIIGKDISELLENNALLNEIGDAALKDASPIDDIRGSSEYRISILKTLTIRALLKAINRIENS